MTAVLYYLLRTPGCYSKLQEEIDTHLSTHLSDLSYHKTLFSEAHTLPYLNACIQEAFRLHLAVSFSSERVIPPSGATIDGHFVPGGTIVGCNPWVIHQDKATFGDDADHYRPERWLGEPEAVHRMSQTLFQFGAGNHLCLGKNIAYLEISKLIPSLMRTFEVRRIMRKNRPPAYKTVFNPPFFLADSRLHFFRCRSTIPKKNGLVTGVDL